VPANPAPWRPGTAPRSQNPASNPAGGAFPHHDIGAFNDPFIGIFSAGQHLHEQTGKLPSQLALAGLDAAVISGFLRHLGTSRGNGITTRNARLTAIHSLFRYAALQVPEHAALITRVLAVPAKRAAKTQVCFLTKEELEALLAAPDRGTWHGRRDHALILLAAQTGLGYPSSPGSPPTRFTWVPALTSGAPERAGNSDARR
jgi:integrase/recombinase XerD